MSKRKRNLSQNELFVGYVDAAVDSKTHKLLPGAELHYGRWIPGQDTRKMAPLCGIASRFVYTYGRSLRPNIPARRCRRCQAKALLLPLTITDAIAEARPPSSNTGVNL